MLGPLVTKKIAALLSSKSMGGFIMTPISCKKSFIHTTVEEISESASISASQLDFVTDFCLELLQKIGPCPRVMTLPV